MKLLVIKSSVLFLAAIGVWYSVLSVFGSHKDPSARSLEHNRAPVRIKTTLPTEADHVSIRALEHDRTPVRTKGTFPTDADHVLYAPRYTTVMVCPAGMESANVDAMSRWSATLASPELMRFGTSADEQVCGCLYH